MKNYIISVDSSCDCSKEELDKKQIFVIPFKYNDSKTTYVDNQIEKGYKYFYMQMKSGTVYKTSQINPNEYYEYFNDLLKYNLPIIHISLGSGVSNTYNSALLAVEMLKEDNKNIDIKVIDSKLASLGSTLLMNDLINYDNSNLSATQAYDKIMEKVDTLNAYYTTDTLTYFARGGRLSKVEAFIGNSLKINPILDCDPDGKLRVIEKVRGERKALDHLISRIKNSVVNPSTQTIYICHADNEIKAVHLANRLVKEVGFKDYKIYFMGPIIGAHTGPSLVAAFFYGKKRSKVVENLSKVKKEELKDEVNKLV